MLTSSTSLFWVSYVWGELWELGCLQDEVRVGGDQVGEAAVKGIST